MGSTCTQILFHVVFSTKGRYPLITSYLRPQLYKYIGGIIKGEGAEFIEIGGTADHVHLVIRIKPSILLSNLMQKIKGNSSKWVNEQVDQKNKFQWQNGYGAFSVSVSRLDKLLFYVRNQEEHHRKKSFKAELMDFLKKQHVEYDEKYLWD